MDWGDFPTWVQAVVTAGALGAAVWAGRATWKVFNLERAREDRAEDEARERRAADERAAQADLVAVWHTVLGSGLAEGPLPTDWAARVINDSPLPVYEVSVEFYGPDGTERDVQRTFIVPPGGQDFYWQQDLRKVADHDTNGHPIYTESPQDFRVALRFRDTAGRQWYRDANGVLTKTGTVVFGRLEAELPALHGGGVLSVRQTHQDEEPDGR